LNKPLLHVLYYIVAVLDQIDDNVKNIPFIVDKIKDCFENFPERYKDFDFYRRQIREEPIKFKENIKNIFNIREV